MPSGRWRGRLSRSRSWRRSRRRSTPCSSSASRIAVVGLAVLMLFVPRGPRTSRSSRWHSTCVRPRRRPQSTRATDHAGRDRARCADRSVMRSCSSATDALPTSDSSSSRCSSPRSRSCTSCSRYRSAVSPTASASVRCSSSAMAFWRSSTSACCARRRVCSVSLAVVGGLGLFYAATDGVLMAAATTLLGASTRATGLAVVATGSAIGRMVAAVLFGLLWTRFGPKHGVPVLRDRRTGRDGDRVVPDLGRTRGAAVSTHHRHHINRPRACLQSDRGLLTTYDAASASRPRRF